MSTSPIDSTGSLGTEILDSGLWIYNRLITDPVLDDYGLGRKVFDGLAPDDTPFPFIVYQWEGGNDIPAVTTEGSGRLMERTTWLIKLIVQSERVAAVKPFTDRIDQLFHVPAFDQRTTLDNGTEWMTVLTARRTEPFSMFEQTGGRVWRHTGGIYEIYTQSFLLPSSGSDGSEER